MKIKDITALAAAAALVLASCTKGPAEHTYAASEIGFTAQSVGSGDFSRAASITTPGQIAGSGGFGVWAYSHTGPWSTATDKLIYIDNTSNDYSHVASPDGGATWDYGTLKMWPGGKNMSFFAYAPHDATMSIGFDNDVPVIAFDVYNDYTSQVDLMIADAVIDRQGPNPVTENFHHALSRIRFKALKHADHAGDEVIIKSIMLGGLYNSGTAKMQTPVVWTCGASTSDYTLSVDNGALTGASVGETAAFVTTEAGELMLMPQTLARGGTDQPVRIVIELTVNGREFVFNGPLPLSPAAWEAEYRYTYTLNINADAVAITCGALEPATPGGGWGEF